MKIEYKIIEEEFIRLMFYLRYRNKFILTLLVVSAALLLLSLREFFVFNQPITTTLPPIGLFIYCFILVPVYYFYNFRKEFRSNHSISQNTVLEINDQFIRDISETYTTETNWSNVHRIEEHKSWFLIYYSNNLFGLAPKRVMTTNQMKELREMIQTKQINAKFLRP